MYKNKDQDAIYSEKNHLNNTNDKKGNPRLRDTWQIVQARLLGCRKYKAKVVITKAIS